MLKMVMSSAKSSNSTFRKKRCFFLHIAPLMKLLTWLLTRETTAPLVHPIYFSRTSSRKSWEAAVIATKSGGPIVVLVKIVMRRVDDKKTWSDLTQAKMRTIPCLGKTRAMDGLAQPVWRLILQPPSVTTRLIPSVNTSINNRKNTNRLGVV